MGKYFIVFILVFSSLYSQIPDRRIVAEWEPALGTMIRWPLGIPSDLVAELAEDDILYVLVENMNQLNSARNSFISWNIDMSNVDFVFTDTYSHWTRDHGPQFLIGENHWEVVNQEFDGYPVESGCQEVNNLNGQDEGRPLDDEGRGWEEDDDTNIDFANHLNWDILDIPVYWTGGNFMTDGYGMGFSTELMVNENNMNENEFKNIIEEYLSIDSYHILDNPNVESIQHIDCMAKLVDSETIIIKQVSELSPEYECIEEFADYFYDLNTFYGRPFEIHRIYCPEIDAPWWEVNSVAAYTNSLILNSKVLVPQYGISADVQALEIYEQAMPGYEVIGFNESTSSPWYGEDALHCRVMGIFDPNMIHISHKSIRDEDIISNGQIYIEAEVVDYANQGIDLIMLHWKYSAEDGPFSQIELEFSSDNIYSATFPILNSNALIEYYIVATNSEGGMALHPNAGWHTFNTLEFMIGDINEDTFINIQDIVLMINLVLMQNYNGAADLNFDGIIDVLDIVQLVNIVLS